MKYFLHDTSSFDDEKITLLFMEFGYEGLGLFYTTLEKMGKQEKPINTIALKAQLKVGKRLDKCWKFMEEIGIIHSNNGETFNKELLNFSEKYQIKKEKNREKVSEWRERQKDTKGVTSNEPVRNRPKVNKTKVKETKEINILIDGFNEITGRDFRGDDKTKRQLNGRLKEGYTIEEILLATKACFNSEYHRKNPQYLTPEFITRSDKLQQYLNYARIQDNQGEQQQHNSNFNPATGTWDKAEGHIN